MFWRKPGILISDLYLYSIKIQTNIDQNTVKKYTRKSQIFWKYFFDFFLLGRTWPAHFGWGWAGTAWPSKQKQTVENSPLFICNVNNGATRARKKKKKRSGGLPGGYPFLQELKLPVICCWTVVLFLLYSVFSLFLLLPAFVSCFSFSSSASSGGDVVVDGGLRWQWWLQTVALLCDGRQCLLLFFSSVRGAGFFFFFTGVAAGGWRWWEADGSAGDRLGSGVLRSLFLFSSVSVLLHIFVSVTLLLSFFFLPLLHLRSLSLFLSFLSLLPLHVLCVSLFSSTSFAPLFLLLL